MSALRNTKRLGRFATSSNNDSHSPSYFDELMSLYDSIGWKPSLDQDKPLFCRRRSSLEKVLAHANQTVEKSRKFFNRIESKKQSPINRATSIPEKATIRQEYIKYGKMFCMQEHGPYYYVQNPYTCRDLISPNPLTIWVYQAVLQLSLLI